MIQRLTLSGKRARSRRSSRIARPLLSEQLETRALLAGDLMQNPASITDVNADGLTTPVDVLLILNELNHGGARSLVSGEDPGNTALFYDVSGDAFLSPMDALMVLNQLNAEGEDELLVQIRLEVTDVDGAVIENIDANSTFVLNGYVKDLTERADGGVFSGYLDVNYNSDLAAVSSEIRHGSSYGNAPSGDTSTPGLIDEVGSIDGLSPLGPTERLLFNVDMLAEATGNVTFAPSFADVSPLHDVLLFGADQPVAEAEIMFVGTALQIGATEAPVAADDFYESTWDVDLEVDAEQGVLANDSDPAGGTLTASLVGDAGNGGVELAADGSFVYTPNPGFFGIDSFTYVANAGGAASNVATVQVDVRAVNRPPVAVDDEYSTPEDSVLNTVVGVLANDFDPDGDALNSRFVTLPSNGTLQLNGNGNFTYTPEEDFFGTDSFVYLANDGLLDSNEATVTINVTAVNDGPIAVPDFYMTGAGTQLTVAAADGVLVNDVDPEGDGLLASVVELPQNGTVQLDLDGSFVYTPNADFVGEDTFTYVASDDVDTSNVATVTITVSDDVLMNVRLEATNAEGTPVTAVSPGSQVNLNVYVQDARITSPDGVFSAYLDVVYSENAMLVSDELSFNEIYANQQSGDLSTAGLIDDAWAFDGLSPLGPEERLLFSASFIADGVGTMQFSSDPADLLPAHEVLLYNFDDPVQPEFISYGSVEVAIEQGDPPIAIDDRYETAEDEVLVVTAENGVLANDVDPDSDVLTAILVDSPSHGDLELADDGSFRYTPQGNFFGSDNFTYQASDGANLSNVAVVTIDVTPVVDAPVAVDDFYVIDDMDPLVVDAESGVLSNDFDLEGKTMTAVLADPPQKGTLDLQADGSFVYTPDVGFVGRDTYTYRAEADGVLSNLATVTIDVGNLLPSSIEGMVYFDANDNGQVEEVENRIADVEITLRGTNLLGEEVFLKTNTATDGTYAFDNLKQGSYVLTEFQPRFTLDGKDTISGYESFRNDRFIIDLPAGVEAGQFNFGERGLESAYICNSHFFASRQLEGLWTMIDSSGESHWYNAELAWSEFDSISVKLSENGTNAEIRARAAGTDQLATVSLTRSRNVHLTGDENGYIFQLDGQPEDHGLQRPSSLSASAVDELFADN